MAKDSEELINWGPVLNKDRFLLPIPRQNERSACPHLDKNNFALADVAVEVLDFHLPIVLDPALTTEDVVDARRHFVPLVMIPKSGEKHNSNMNTAKIQFLQYSKNQF